MHATCVEHFRFSGHPCRLREGQAGARLMCGRAHSFGHREFLVTGNGVLVGCVVVGWDAHHRSNQ